ncbi:MAG: hypothetical protein K2N52_03800, partial [Clostridia bacterium]|nr:hypothetical protein [Clostridia bacterium]
AQDNSAMVRLEMELAELRAKLATAQQIGQPVHSVQPVQQMPMQYSNDPVAAAELIRLKAENEAYLRAELERSRSETERARAEAEIAKARAESSRNYMPQFDAMRFGANGDMEKISALAAAIWRGINTVQSPVEIRHAEVPQIAEESTQNSHAQYPSDAVITTTTTVDTTKPLHGSKRDKRAQTERSDFADVDGFYDNADF